MEVVLVKCISASARCRALAQCQVHRLWRAGCQEWAGAESLSGDPETPISVDIGEHRLWFLLLFLLCSLHSNYIRNASSLCFKIELCSQSSLLSVKLDKKVQGKRLSLNTQQTLLYVSISFAVSAVCRGCCLNSSSKRCCLLTPPPPPPPHSLSICWEFRAGLFLTLLRLISQAKTINRLSLPPR